MKILITGITGMLGHRVYLQLKKSDKHILYGIAKSDILQFPIFAGLKNNYIKFDFIREKSLFKILDTVYPDIIINCAGIVKQRECLEEDMVLLNAVLPKHLNEWCSNRGAKLIHVSSDCVFDGEKGNYKEYDTTTARDIYGMSKYLGEVYDSAENNCLTIRTSIIGPELVRSNGLFSFLCDMHGKIINGFTNAYFSGITTNVLAEEIEKFIDNQEIYDWSISPIHIAGETISKYDLVCKINEVFNLRLEILPYELPQKIDRTLDDSYYRELTHTTRPLWDDMLLQLKENK